MFLNKTDVSQRYVVVFPCCIFSLVLWDCPAREPFLRFWLVLLLGASGDACFCCDVFGTCVHGTASLVLVGSKAYQNMLGERHYHSILLLVSGSFFSLLRFPKGLCFCELAVPRPFSWVDCVSPSDLSVLNFINNHAFFFFWFGWVFFRCRRCVCAAHGYSDPK